MRRVFTAIAVAAALSGCSGPASTALDIAGRDYKGRQNASSEQEIRNALARDGDRFRNVRVAVSYGRAWRDFLQTRYDVLLTGRVTSEEDRATAQQLALQTLGVTEDGAQVTNLIRVEN